MNQPECHDHCFVIDTCEGCIRHWSDEELAAWRDYIFKESDLIHAAAQHDKVLAVLRRDVQVTPWMGVWRAYTSDDVRLRRNWVWASQLEREYEYWEPWFDVLYDAIGCPDAKGQEPTWRPVVRRVLGKRDYDTGQMRRILRELGTKDEHGGRDL